MEKGIYVVFGLAVILTIGTANVNAITNSWTNELASSILSNKLCRGVANNTAIPNEASCTQFFICVDGRAVPNTCPSGQWFNPITCLCDSTPNPDCNPSEEFQCPPSGVHFFPYDYDCEKFIMCFAGFPVISRCSEGLHFDRELGTCNFPEYAECLLEICPPENDPKNITFIPSLVDCEKFYICYSGEPLEMRCAPGIHFNPATNQCDFPENANCTIQPPENGDDPLPHEIDCECVDGIYFVPHPNSCAHYFICSQGESILMRCAPDFWFDTEHDWCNLIEEVECSINGTRSIVEPNIPIINFVELN